MSSFSEIAERHDVALLLLYGSAATGGIHERSDVDVGVLYDRPLSSFLDQGGLLADLGECFPDREVDLAVLDRADPLFLKQVMEECELLAGSPRRLAELEIHAFKRYQDHRRYLALEREFVDRVIDERVA